VEKGKGWWEKWVMLREVGKKGRVKGGGKRGKG
jgi:hypothetical protein